MAPTDVVLDLDPDICAAWDRAAALWGVATLPPIEPGEVPCARARARASNRLHLRRLAVRRQRPGEGWSYRDTPPLVDDELARMKVSAAEARGCGRDDCPVCNPLRMCSCGGEGPCGVGSGS